MDKCFPVIPSWAGEITIYILDDTITLPVLEHHLREAGKFIGVGRWRARNNGLYGRFDVLSIKELSNGQCGAWWRYPFADRTLWL